MAWSSACTVTHHGATRGYTGAKGSPSGATKCIVRMIAATRPCGTRFSGSIARATQVASVAWAASDHAAGAALLGSGGHGRPLSAAAAVPQKGLWPPPGGEVGPECRRPGRGRCQWRPACIRATYAAACERRSMPSFDSRLET
ncbi:hypothetical protein GCM10010272_09820 [Streptomyces lateritius]|nr:hypothetical protein GCM10010272_09820 [Streptomyces lateritius]